MSIITDAIAGLTGPVATYFTRRAELKAQRFENEMKLLAAQGERQAQLALQGLTADAAWEMEFARQAATSWKDEAELVIVSIPVVLCFVPGAAPIVSAGFAALATTPGWFQLVLISIYLANYGIRYWRKTQSDT